MSKKTKQKQREKGTLKQYRSLLSEDLQNSNFFGLITACDIVINCIAMIPTEKMERLAKFEIIKLSNVCNGFMEFIFKRTGAIKNSIEINKLELDKEEVELTEQGKNFQVIHGRVMDERWGFFINAITLIWTATARFDNETSEEFLQIMIGAANELHEKANTVENEKP